MLSEYHKWKHELMKDLANAQSKVSISFDGWTLPAQRGYVAICAHFINSKGLQKVILLAVRRLRGRHTSENYASIVGDVLAEYGLDTAEQTR